MFYQIDWSRLIGVLLLLGTGIFITTRFAGAHPPSIAGPASMPTSRVAVRGMWLMTVLGLASGTAGALFENAFGQSWVVLLLHSTYRVCWAPPFWLSSLQQRLVVSDLSLRFFSDVLGLLGVLLVPVLWFVVFLSAARLLERLRRARLRSCTEARKCDVCSKPPLTAESVCNKPAASVPKRRDATS